MITGSIRQENIAIYVVNIEISKYIFEQILMNLNRETDNNTVIVEDFSTPI